MTKLCLHSLPTSDDVIELSDEDPEAECLRLFQEDEIAPRPARSDSPEPQREPSKVTAVGKHDEAQQNTGNENVGNERTTFENALPQVGRVLCLAKKALLFSYFFCSSFRLCPLASWSADGWHNAEKDRARSISQTERRT